MYQVLQSILVMCYLWLCRWWCVRVLRRLLTLLWSLRNSRDGGACRPPVPILCPCSLITQSRFKSLETTKRQTTAKTVQSSGKDSSSRENNRTFTGKTELETLRPFGKTKKKTTTTGWQSLTSLASECRLYPDGEDDPLLAPPTGGPGIPGMFGTELAGRASFEGKQISLKCLCVSVCVGTCTISSSF